MSERHNRDDFERAVTQKEHKENQSEYQLCLYSDFVMPEIGKPLAVGRVLDEEVYLSYDYDPDDHGPTRQPQCWVGNNGSAGWRQIGELDPSQIYDAFKDVAKAKLFAAAMHQGGGSQGTGYWYQKFINRREPGSQDWKTNTSNRPYIKRPGQSAD